MLKSIIISLSMILVLSFAACGNKNAGTNGNNDNNANNGNNSSVMEDIGQGMDNVKNDMKNAVDDMMGTDNQKNN